MPHRPPTRHDIGKTVEVRAEGKWIAGVLSSIRFEDEYCSYRITGRFGWHSHCRVPYTTPDPIAELAQAADWLAERGQDEASRVLMREVEGRLAPCSNCGKVCDVEKMLRPYELITDDICCSEDCCEAMNDRT